VIVDFGRGGALDELAARCSQWWGSVTRVLEDGEVLGHFRLNISEPLKRWRCRFFVRPAANKPLALRGYLQHEGNPLTET